MAANESAIRMLAPAKVNLFLRVLRRRSDGLHDLDSLIAFVDLYDRVTASPAPRVSLAASGPFAAALPTNNDNLALRAALALRTALGVTDGAVLHLHKEIPVAAGLGGGSADAAATLIALLRLWRRSMPRPALLALATSLGADVPACLEHRALRVSGLGDRIVPAPPLPTLALVLVNPGVPLSTAAAFQRFAATTRTATAFRWRPNDGKAVLITALAAIGNDLTAAARTLVPEIDAVLAALTAAGSALAQMSGSGATCFGLFETAAAATRATAAIAAAHPTWWLRTATTSRSAPLAPNAAPCDREQAAIVLFED